MSSPSPSNPPVAPAADFSADASAELVRRLQAGDNDAMDALLRTVQPRLFRFSMAMCRHPQDAEDVLQDSLIAVARSVRGFRGQAALSTWLYTIARNHCIKKRRRGKFAPDAEESLESVLETNAGQLQAQGPAPDEQVDQAALWRRVHQGIRALPEEFREVLVLRDIEGLTAPEVATVTGVSVAAVKSRLHRARNALRDHLVDTPVQPLGDCPNIRDVFSRYLEGELSSDICASMQTHVAGCTTCATECDGLKTALSACQSAPAVVPEAVQQRVRHALGAVLSRDRSD